MIALKTASGLTPALVASTKASDTAAMLSATMIWLASLVTFPAPMSPTRTTEDPIFSRMGLTVSKAFASPPTMTASVPSMALGSPPETGASSMTMPFSLTAVQISCAAPGAIELMSTRIVPAFAPSSTPSLPSTASLTCRRVGQHGDDHFTLRRDVLVGDACLGAEGNQIVDFGNLVVDDQRIASLEQVLDHRATHDAQANKSDFHLTCPLVVDYFR